MERKASSRTMAFGARSEHIHMCSDSQSSLTPALPLKHLRVSYPILVTAA